MRFFASNVFLSVSVDALCGHFLCLTCDKCVDPAPLICDCHFGLHSFLCLIVCMKKAAAIKAAAQKTCINVFEGPICSPDVSVVKVCSKILPCKLMGISPWLTGFLPCKWCCITIKALDDWCPVAINIARSCHANSQHFTIFRVTSLLFFIKTNNVDNEKVKFSILVQLKWQLQNAVSN